MERCGKICSLICAAAAAVTAFSIPAVSGPVHAAEERAVSAHIINGDFEMPDVKTVIGNEDKISKIPKSDKIIGVKIMRINKNNVQMMKYLLMWTFSKEIYDISSGEDYIQFKFNSSSLICIIDDETNPLVYQLILGVSKKKMDLPAIRAMYKEYKRTIVQPKRKL